MSGALTIAFVIWFLTQQFQRDRRLMSPEEVRSIIRTINRQEFNGWFSEDDVMAIVQIESSFDPEARRFEPHIVTELTPHGDASLGLMQILYSTAVDRGHRGPPGDLFDPTVNVRMGMRQLFWSWEFLEQRLGAAPSQGVWIGSYNGGVGAALKGRTPAAYVAKWVKAREAISKRVT